MASKEEREFEIMSYSLLKQYFDTNEFIIIPRGCFHNLNQLPKGIFPHFFVNLNDTIISYMQQRKGWYSEPDYVIIKRDSIDKWMIIKTIRNTSRYFIAWSIFFFSNYVYQSSDCTA